jgi:coenzyme F420-reducing hydrogenase beta subunit
MKAVIENQYNDCVGCNTCVQICPKSCITMQTNDEGFWYPYIDETLCVNCGLCKERCPVNYELLSVNNLYPDVFGAINLDCEVKNDSFSGGVFSVLANVVLENDGAVFGAAFNNAMELQQIMIEDISHLNKLRGSKYVQSDVNSTFSDVKQMLIKNRLVLYVGTPCQVAGLKSFLNQNYENLITCDLICKGVPSPGVFRDYLHEVEENRKVKVIDYKFRDKTKGWKKPSISVKFENGMIETSLYKQDRFTVAFSKNVLLRSSCYSCKFSKLPRIADISLGDFWGVGDYYPELDDDKGTSLVLINSSKGKSFFEKCAGKMHIKQVEIDKALKNNKNATSSVKKPEIREKFFEDYRIKGYKYVEKKYMRPHTILYRVIKKFKNMVSRLIK